MCQDPLKDYPSNLMSREDVIELLKDELSIQISTSSEYNGGLDGGSLYKDSRKVELYLGNTLISYAYLD